MELVLQGPSGNRPGVVVKIRWLVTVRFYRVSPAPIAKRNNICWLGARGVRAKRDRVLGAVTTKRQRQSARTGRKVFQLKRNILLLRQNPNFRVVDDAEIVSDSGAEAAEFFWDGFAQESEDGLAELALRGVAAV